MIKALLLTACVFLFGCHASLPPLPPSWQCNPCIAAHRGDRNGFSDNSIAAIHSAVQLDAEIVEVDVRVTTDGIPFLFHDKTLRAANILEPARLFERSAATLSAEELSHIRLPRGEAVATLEAALALLKNTKAVLLLDVKESSPIALTAIERVVREADASRRVIVLCYNAADLEWAKSRLHRAPVAARVNKELSLEQAIAANPFVIQIDKTDATAERVSEIHRRGSRVLVKTLDGEIDSEESWKALRENGVDFILTDFPAAIDAMRDRE